MRIFCDFNFQTSGHIEEHQGSQTGFENLKQTLSGIHSDKDKSRKNEMKSIWRHALESNQEHLKTL